MKSLVGGASLVLLLGAVMSGQSSNAGTACERLATFMVRGGTITRAEAVAAGAFTPPGDEDGNAFRTLPAFCRVAATLKPIERFRHQDRGLAADGRLERQVPGGRQRRLQRHDQLRRDGDGARARLRDELHRHRPHRRRRELGARPSGEGDRLRLARGPRDDGDAKTIVAAYYDARAEFSYWNGCSAGGRQAMKEAQRFPAISTASSPARRGSTGPAAPRRRCASRRFWRSNEAARLMPPQRQLLHHAVLDACDALDGVKDGLIENPQRCTFDPAVLECKGGDGAACLTKAQVETARMMYAAAINPKTERGLPALRRAASWDGPTWVVGFGARDRPRSIPVPRLRATRAGRCSSSISTPTSSRAEETDATRSTHSIRI